MCIIGAVYILPSKNCPSNSFCVVSQLSCRVRHEHIIFNVLCCLQVVSRDAAVYTCLVCSADEKFIADSKGITHHLKECHNLRLYICDMCGQEFFKRSELSAHLDEHITNEERDFQCEVCNRIFSNLRLYRVHKRMHYPQHKNWTCDQCGKRYL